MLGEHRYLYSSPDARPVARIAVLVSGSGTNFQAIIDDEIPVALLLSDQPDAYALTRAEKARIESVIIPRSEYKGRREELTQAIVDQLVAHHIDIVVLAGFMTILSPSLFDQFPNRVLNVHPSLLPAFTGTHGRGTMTATLQSGVKVTGVTVHIATAEVDAGPILSQESVEILDGDDEDILHERLQKVEHRLYPNTIRQFCVDFDHNER